MACMVTTLVPGKKMRAFREYDQKSGCVAAPPNRTPYDNEVGKRWTEIAKATDNFKGLRSANFADRWA